MDEESDCKYMNLLNQALGNHESGVVDFHALRQLLVAVLRHLDLSKADSGAGSTEKTSGNRDDSQKSDSLDEPSSDAPLLQTVTDPNTNIETLTKIEETEENALNPSDLQCEGKLVSENYSLLQQRMENLERSIEDLENLKFSKLAERVDSLVVQLPRDNEVKNNSGGNVQISIEKLKMEIGDVNDEVDRIMETLRIMQQKLSNISLDKVSKGDLEEALKANDAQRGNVNANEVTAIKEAVIILRRDVSDICQQLSDFESRVKGRISRVESQLREKADKTELTSAATFMRSEVEQLRNRVRKLASNELLGDLGFNERIKDGAAGLRRKVVFHCLSCDRPLLIESKGRSKATAVSTDNTIMPMETNKSGKSTVQNNSRKTSSNAQNVLKDGSKQEEEKEEQSEQFQDVEETEIIAPPASPKQSDDETDFGESGANPNPSEQ